MESPFDAQVIGIACPHCGEQHARTIAWLKENDAIPCSCGRTIELDPNDFAAALQEIEEQLRRAGGATKH
jgi:hypothetical protein